MSNETQSYVSAELTHFVGRAKNLPDGKPDNAERYKLLLKILGDRCNASPTFAAKLGESGFKGVSHTFTGRVVIHERSVGIQRSSSNALTARRCVVDNSGAIITVARRPRPRVVVRTSVARIAARSPIIAKAESPVPNAIFARLTSISPRTVAKVCSRMDPSAH